MKKKELLSPAGSMEALYQAVQNGCDAVYLSGKSFGARKFATNFNDEEILEAISYCHLYGVKVYVTVNTLIHDREEEEFLNYISFLYENNVDALLMQDLGMIRIVREMFPNLKIHASTQLHNHNQHDIDFLTELGVERVVLARELTIDEINNLDSKIELEVFVHGALCICYSGQCLMSSMVLSRSGNRGECAGLCRLPYDLLENGKEVKTNGSYLLSPKELNTSSVLKKLLDLDNVTSLKIEGRMKSPEYVGFITSLYRKIIDDWYKGKTSVIDIQKEKELKSLFNREFTEGHLFKKQKEDLMNAKSPNHIGIILGQVIEVTPDKIKVQLEECLNQGDGVRFPNGEGMIANFIYNKKDLLISSANKGEIITLDNKVGLDSTGIIRKTSDKVLLDSLSLKEQRKIEIKGSLLAIPNQKLKLEISDGVNQVIKEGNIVEEANTSPTTKERIKEQLNKLGSTPFIFTSLLIETDNAFLPIKELNELRRLATTELINIRKNSITEVTKNKFSINVSSNKLGKPSISVLVRNKEQFDVVKELSVDQIYCDNKSLYEEVKGDNIFLRLKRVITKYPVLSNENLLVGEVGGIYFNRKKNNLVSDYFCNAYNANTVAFFHELGVSLVSLSVELTKEDIIELLNHYKDNYHTNPNVSVLTYGRIELMIMKHCPLTTLLKEETPCKLCKKGNKYELRDRNQECYPIQSDCPYTHIFNYKVTDRRKEISELYQAGCRNFRIDLFDETKEETKEIISSIKKELKNMNN